MFRTREDQEPAIQAAHYELEKKKTTEAVYAKFPLLVRCMANDKAIIELVHRFVGPDVVPTAELFFTALDENPGAINSLSQQPEAITRSQLTAQIIGLLRAKGKGHDAFTLKQEEKRLAFLSISDLRIRLRDLQMKARMASATASTKAAYEIGRFHFRSRPEGRRSGRLYFSKIAQARLAAHA